MTLRRCKCVITEPPPPLLEAGGGKEQFERIAI